MVLKCVFSCVWLDGFYSVYSGLGRLLKWLVKMVVFFVGLCVVIRVCSVVLFRCGRL